jgi:hypothetical protein
MKTAVKCPRCGTLHKPPTYWGALDDGEKTLALFVLIGIVGVAVAVVFLLFLKLLGWWA